MASVTLNQIPKPEDVTLLIPIIYTQVNGIDEADVKGWGPRGGTTD